MKYVTGILTIVLLIILLFPTSLPAQEPDHWNLLDPFLKNMLRQDGITSEMFRQNRFPEIADSLLGSYAGDRLYHVILHSQPNVIEKHNIHTNTVFRNFSTARVDLRELHALAGHGDVNLIEHGAPMEIVLDKSRAEIGGDVVNEGSGIETAYTGKGIIIGIIDTGLDIFHPDFLSSDPNEGIRILSLWDTTLDPQSNESNPSGFNYGVEYRKDEIDATLDGTAESPIRTRDPDGHGTHVAGIAAGSGYHSDGLYRGIAPDAYLIIVRVSPSGISPSVLIDGMSYIFGKADDLQKPAVINFSVGGHGGAHDGTSPLEEAIKSYSNEPGKAVVVAAGNSGAQKIHAGGIVAPSDTAFISLIIDEYNLSTTNYALNLLWYENLDNQGMGPFPAETMNLTVISPRGYSLSVNSGDEVTEDTEDGKIIIESYGKNQKNARLIYLEITDTDENKPPHAGTWDIVLTHASGTGDVQYNFWTASHTFGNKLEVHPTTGREYTVTIPGTAEGAITVGSYITKNTWTDTNGIPRSTSSILGELSNYSGGGPTRDRRLKPTITAPGQLIAAAASSDASFSSTRLTETQGYVVMEGTSMATPHITGTVALLFEINPSLNAMQVKQILSSTGRNDMYTGILPNTGWGFGKVDVFAAAVEAGAIVAVHIKDPDLPVSYVLEQNFPNPFNPLTVIRYGVPTRKHVMISIYNAIGQLVAQPVNELHDAGWYEVYLDASHVSSGIYFYRLQAGHFTRTKKATVLK
jgi:minor extracellular serine protease Vpr